MKLEALMNDLHRKEAIGDWSNLKGTRFHLRGETGKSRVPAPKNPLLPDWLGMAGSDWVLTNIFLPSQSLRR